MKRNAKIFLMLMCVFVAILFYGIVTLPPSQPASKTIGNETRMNKELFWSLIERNKSEDTEVMLSNLMSELSELPSEDVQIFRGYLCAYMGYVNECIWVDMACKVINGYVSDDTALYFALWLIAQGETVLINALANPDSLSELMYIPFGNAEFEMLMSVGMDESDDYHAVHHVIQKCNMEIAPSIVYKDGSKDGAYGNFEEGMADIPNVLPSLIERAKREGFDWKGLY